MSKIDIKKIMQNATHPIHDLISGNWENCPHPKEIIALCTELQELRDYKERASKVVEAALDTPGGECHCIIDPPCRTCWSCALYDALKPFTQVQSESNEETEE